MTMQNLPEVVTRADLANVASAAHTVGNSPLIGGDPKQWFDMVETALKFAERFNTQLERAVTTINAVQGMKNTGEDAGMIDNGPLTPRLDDFTQPYRPPPREAVIQEPPEPTPEPQPQPQPAPRMPAKKLYREALGALADLEKMDPNLTVSNALILAREYKSIILPMIEQRLEQIMAEND
jgi:hypothetical protein